MVAGNRGYTGDRVLTLLSTMGSKLAMQLLRARLLSIRTLAVLSCLAIPAAGAGQLPLEDVSPANLIADGSSAQSTPGIAAASSSGLSGPSSVAGQLQSDADSSEGEKPLLPAEQRLKDRWQKNYGLELGGDYNLLGIYATDSLGEDAAAGGALRLYGQWRPFARRAPGSGALVFKVEHRHKLGTDVAPQSLGTEIGYAGIPATVFSDAGALLTNLYWTQQLADNRFAFNVGVVDVTDYIDVYGLVNPWTDFNNLVFTTSPSIPSPNQGLGAAARFSFSSQYYILAGIADANGNPEEPEDFLHSFFNKAEYFKHVEAGWVESFDKRFTDNIHLLLWQVDERTEADVPDGWGASFSFSRLLNDRWMPFVRAGYADDGGAILKRTVSAGTGDVLDKKNNVVGFGAEWGRPADSFGDEASKQDQYTFELYMRWQPLPAVQIVPGVQYIINPALNQARDSLWLPGLRLRAVF